MDNRADGQRKPHNEKLCPGAWLLLNTLKVHNYRSMWVSGPLVHSSSTWLPRWTAQGSHGTLNFWGILSYVPSGSVDPSEMAFSCLNMGVIYKESVSSQWSNPIWAFWAIAGWEQSAWLQGLSGLEQPDRNKRSVCTALGDGQRQGRVPRVCPTPCSSCSPQWKEGTTRRQTGEIHT